jgi:predicted signal transduction protein with EAL and GGDEF domain
MVSFLVLTDRYGIVEEILWSQPISLIGQPQISIYDIFSLEQYALLQVAFKKTLISDKMHDCDQRFRLRNFDIYVRCCMVAYNEQILVLCAQIDEKQEENPNSVHLEIINRMMWQCIYLLAHKSELKQTNSINQFDQIQKLNNELVNTHRSLQKANAQLNRLNQELNNRLVKDALTGLVSRYQYRSEIERLIGSDPLALGVFVFIDIDNFKGINDTYGHAVGDTYLIEFSNRLRKLSLLGSMIFMRIAGDEFGVYIHGLKAVDEAYLENF